MKVPLPLMEPAKPDGIKQSETDPRTHKTCLYCWLDKPMKDFYSSQHNKNKCKDCAQLYARLWKKKNTELTRQQRLRYREKYPDRVRASNAASNHKRDSAVVGGTQKKRGHQTVDPFVIFERDNWICWLCNEKIDPSLPRQLRLGATVDCVIPISKGGMYSYENCKAAHRSCNSRRGAKDLTNPT